MRVGSIPEATFTPDDPTLVCNSTELRIDFRDMPAFYGYQFKVQYNDCLLYTSDAADERSSVDLGGRRIIKKKKVRLIEPHPYDF